MEEFNFQWSLFQTQLYLKKCYILWGVGSYLNPWLSTSTFNTKLNTSAFHIIVRNLQEIFHKSFQTRLLEQKHRNQKVKNLTPGKQRNSLFIIISVVLKVCSLSPPPFKTSASRTRHFNVYCSLGALCPF